jgi:hypothetical protein
VPLTHAPLTHVCGALPLHCAWLGPHTPVHDPDTHVVLLLHDEDDMTYRQP